MGNESDSPELTALSAVVAAIKPLNQAMRVRVVDAALLLLNEAKGDQGSSRQSHDPSLFEEKTTKASLSQTREMPVDIRQLKEQKSPRSANEMTALVAFYLAELAPVGEQKTSVSTTDIEKYFKQARFPLPKKMSNTLSNAKDAGYFDAAGPGHYRLNAVGHNLVTHSLPRSKRP